jgi:hypothetical protein
MNVQVRFDALGIIQKHKPKTGRQMLTRLEVQNYRGFPSFELDGLSRVNLLVGKNNSGKTALLEAAHFLVSSGDPDALAMAAHRRGEVIMRSPDRTMLVEIGHFFNNHTTSLDTQFSVKGNNGFGQITVKILTEAGKEKEGEPMRSGLSRSIVKITGGKREEKGSGRFVLTRDGGIDLDDPRPWRKLQGGRRGDGPPIRFVATEHLESVVLVSLWDDVQEAAQSDDVLRALKILEPDVERFFMVSGVTSYGYVIGSRTGPKVHLKGNKNPIPLGSMGEGMRRLLSLSMSLAATSEGYLFVDEIDTGLHYSVMIDMWTLVIETAKKFNMQVFATTHSWDCLEGLGEYCRKNPAMAMEVAVHKIERSLERGVAFSGDRLPSVIDSKVEIR